MTVKGRTNRQESSYGCLRVPGLAAIDAAASIVKGNGAEVPPTGMLFTTVTFTVPAVARSEARTAAVSCPVPELNVVTRAFGPKNTTEFALKLLPVTVSGNPAAPAFALAGESAVMQGCMLFSGVTSNSRAFEVPPSGAGFVTVMWSTPGHSKSCARITAVSSFDELTEVVRGLPLKLTEEVEMKFVPVTTSAKLALPEAALV